MLPVIQHLPIDINFSVRGIFPSAPRLNHDLPFTLAPEITLQRPAQSIREFVFCFAFFQVLLDILSKACVIEDIEDINRVTASIVVNGFPIQTLSTTLGFTFANDLLRRFRLFACRFNLGFCHSGLSPPVSAVSNTSNRPTDKS